MGEGGLLYRCRICLGDHPTIDIFSKYSDTTVSVPCSEIILFVFTLHAQIDDGLPRKLCNTCYEQLISAYKLILLAKESYSTLVEYINNCTDTKQIKVDNTVDSNFNQNVKEEKYVKVEVGEIALTSTPNYGESVIYDEDLAACVTDELDTKSIVDGAVETGSEDDTPLAQYNTINKDPPSKSRVKRVKRITKNKPTKKKKTVEKIKTIKNRLWVCDVCGKHVYNIQAHSKIHTTNRKLSLCPECPKKFIGSSGLRRHRESCHLGNKYFCEICNKSYTRKNEHIQMKHSDRPMLNCVLCNKQFLKQSLLKQHMTSHTKERPYSCDICGEAFMTSTVFRKHKKRVHENERTKMCQICSKGFFSNYYLQEHMKTHLQEKVFNCSMCDKKFVRKLSLQTHEKRHNGIKKFSCEFCDKTFVCTTSLKTHKITHTKEKVHPCRYCGTMFGRTDHRNRHEKTAHKGIPEKEQ